MRPRPRAATDYATRTSSATYAPPTTSVLPGADGNENKSSLVMHNSAPGMSKYLPYHDQQRV